MHRFLSLIVRSRWKKHNFQWNKFIEFDSILTWDSFWYKIQISSDAMGIAWNYQMIKWIRVNLDTFFLLLSFFLLPDGVHVIKYMIYNIPPPPPLHTLSKHFRKIQVMKTTSSPKKLLISHYVKIYSKIKVI